MKKYFFPFLFTLLILFNSFFPSVVYANTYVPVVSPVSTLVNTAKTLIPVIAPFAPEIALVACVAISAGVVFENREQVISMAGGLYRGLLASGHAITTSATGALSMGLDSLNWIKNDIASLNGGTPQTIVLGTTGAISLVPLSMNGVTMSTGFTILHEWGGSMWHINAGQVLLLTAFGNGYYDFWVGASHYSTSMSETELFQLVPDNADGSICLNPSYPQQVFSGDITGNIGGTTGTFPRTAPTTYNPDMGITIPSTLPLEYSPSGTSDWVGDLVGTSDFTTTFPIADSVPITPPVTAPLDWSIPTATPSIDFTPFQNFNLTNKFPFSIPWDIKNSFQTLVAPSVAPTFDIDMTHWLGGTHYIINFTMFDKLASILRWGLLMAFNIGLIIKTRSIIRG